MADPQRLIVVILRTADLEAPLRFYRDALGVPLASGHNEPESDPWYGGRHAELSWREGAYLHFALFPARPPRTPATTGAEIAFLVEDAAVLHERAIAAGAAVLHAPRREPWGLTARYRDPDGNIVGVTSR